MGHLVLNESFGRVLMQLAVSAVGIGIMVAVAALMEWFAAARAGAGGRVAERAPLSGGGSHERDPVVPALRDRADRGGGSRAIARAPLDQARPSMATSSRKGRPAPSAFSSAGRSSPGLATRIASTPMPRARSTKPRSGATRSMFG